MKDHVAELDRQDLKASKENVESEVQEDRQVKVVILVLLENKVHLVAEANVDQEAQQESREMQEPRVYQDWLVNQDLLGLLDLQVLLERLSKCQTQFQLVMGFQDLQV